jgi:hypothetical protein
MEEIQMRDEGKPVNGVAQAKHLSPCEFMYKGSFWMRRLSEMSLDELYDVEEKLLQELDGGGEKDGIYSEIVMVYEQLFLC